MVLRYREKPSPRQLKVASELRMHLSQMFLRNELSHPFFEQHVFNVIDVRISKDLKQATAFITVPQELPIKETMKFFNEISQHIRRILSGKIYGKITPHLHFVEDQSQAEEINLLLNKINNI